MEQLQSDIYQVFIEADRYKMFLDGLKVTIGVSIAAVLLGILLGMILALMKMTEVRKGKKTIFSVIANIYIDIIRGTPTVVQLLIIYFLVFQTQMGMVAGIVTFGINSSAYVAEIIRAGIMAVDNGQMEAGRSLGLSYTETMRYIILPQAVKNILPALCNEFVAIVKETSLASTFFIGELMTQFKTIQGITFRVLEPLTIIGIIYFLLTFVLSKLIALLERRMSASER